MYELPYSTFMLDPTGRQVPLWQHWLFQTWDLWSAHPHWSCYQIWLTWLGNWQETPLIYIYISSLWSSMARMKSFIYLGSLSENGCQLIRWCTSSGTKREYGRIIFGNKTLWCVSATTVEIQLQGSVCCWRNCSWTPIIIFPSHICPQIENISKWLHCQV